MADDETDHGFSVSMPSWFEWRSWTIGFVLGVIPGLAFLELVVPVL